MRIRKLREAGECRRKEFHVKNGKKVSFLKNKKIL